MEGLGVIFSQAELHNLQSCKLCAGRQKMGCGGSVHAAGGIGHGLLAFFSSGASEVARGRLRSVRLHM